MGVKKEAGEGTETAGRKTVEAELEGGGTTWWYVCGECRGAVNYRADVCPHCKNRLRWEGFDLPRRNYVGEMTEPAE